MKLLGLESLIQSMSCVQRRAVRPRITHGSAYIHSLPKAQEKFKGSYILAWLACALYIYGLVLGVSFDLCDSL